MTSQLKTSILFSSLTPSLSLCVMPVSSPSSESEFLYLSVFNFCHISQKTVISQYMIIIVKNKYNKKLRNRNPSIHFLPLIRGRVAGAHESSPGISAGWTVWQQQDGRTCDTSPHTSVYHWRRCQVLWQWPAGGWTSSPVAMTAYPSSYSLPPPALGQKGIPVSCTCVQGCLCLQKSTTSSLVFPALSRRWFRWHQSTKSLISSL